MSAPGDARDCPFHPGALRMERTLLGRMGCANCLVHPDNFDAPLDHGTFIDIELGETSCPYCHVHVAIRGNDDGTLRVINRGGTLHRHGNGVSS